MLVCAASGCDAAHVGSELAEPQREPQLAPAQQRASSRAPTQAASSSSLEALALPERFALERALAEDDPRHQPKPERGGGFSFAHANGMQLFVEPAGARVSLPSAAPFQLSVARVGRAGSELALQASAPTQSGAEVRRALGSGVTELWRSLGSGLEHAVALERRVPGGGPLHVALALEGARVRPIVLAGDDPRTAGPVDAADPNAVELLAPDGALLARYGELLVLDARSQPVPARLRVLHGGLRIEIDDADAAYPLYVDPLLTLQEAVFPADVGRAGEWLGRSIAIASDGSRVLLGAPSRGGLYGTGCARVFVRQGASFVEEAELRLADPEPADLFGDAVALSADGRVALVGTPGRETLAGGPEAGSATVFVRDGSAWSELTTLVASDGDVGDYFGSAVALSADGSTALVGAQLHSELEAEYVGSAYVFVRDGAGYREDGVLQPSDPTGTDRFGSAVALSGDGRRALVGAPEHGPDQLGAAYVFARATVRWNEEAALVAAEGAAYHSLGTAVAFSGDGALALVGAPGADWNGGVRTGAVRVFARTINVWDELPGLGPALGLPDGWFGSSLGLSSDGTRAIVASPADATGENIVDSAHVFVRGAGGFELESTLTVSDAMSTDWSGQAVALAGDGTLAVLGAAGAETPAGVASGRGIAFERTGTTWAEGAVLAGTEAGEVEGAFGHAVALAIDGTRALVGAPFSSMPGATNVGRARVLVRTGTTWDDEAVLRAADGAEGDHFGGAVALSDDGSLALIGAPFDDTSAGEDAGSVRVFERSGASWTQVAVLLASAAAPHQAFGDALALSADGTRALVLSLSDGGDAGSGTGTARVFLRQGSSWSEEAVLAGSGPKIDLSGDGSHALLSDQRRGLLYVRNGASWTLETTLETDIQALPSASLSHDGSRAVAAGRIFTRAGTTWTRAAPAYALAVSPDGNRAIVARPAFRFGLALTLSVWTGSDWVDSAMLPFVASPASGLATALDADGSRLLFGLAGPPPGSGVLLGGAAVVFRFESSPLGGICTHDVQCSSGACSDGVCCDQDCGGGVSTDCRACDAASTGLADGTCALLSAEAVDSHVCRPAAGLCDVAERCVLGFAECPGDALAPFGTVCELGSCAGGNATDERVCDGTSSACERPTTGHACHPFACFGQVCASSCLADVHCAPDRRCDATGSCVPRLPPASTCTRDRECQSGSCADGVCCASACSGQCEACNVLGQQGQCVPVFGAPQGGRAPCGGDGSICSGTCDGVSRTSCTFPTATTLCRTATASGGLCTTEAFCNGSGSCPFGVTFGCPFDPGTEPPFAGTSGGAGTGAGSGAGSGATAGASGSGNVLRPPDFFPQDAGDAPNAKLPLTTIMADPIDCGCHLAGVQGSAARTLALLPALALLVTRMRSRRRGSSAARRER